MTNYADAGVDIDAGNRAVKLMGDAVRSTNTPAVLSELGAFGGLFSTEGLGDGSLDSAAAARHSITVPST